MTLTDITIRKAKTRERPYKVSDEGGLYLWVTPAGGKHWRWTYRHEGKQKLMTFGKYPDVPLVLARERHIEARKLLATGVDPMEQRKAEKITLRSTAQDSFHAIALQWYDHWKVEKSAQHVDATLRRMDTNIFPLLGTSPITEIEAPELVAMVKAIEPRGATDLAKRAMENAGQIFRYAIAHGYVKRNPASEIRPADVLKPIHKTNLARINAKGDDLSCYSQHDLDAIVWALNTRPRKSLDWKCLAEVFLPNFDFVKYWHSTFNPVALRP